MQPLKAALVLVFVAVGVVAVAAQEREVLRKPLIGKAPMELVGEKTHWLGKSPPRTLAELKGQVIWLQFNF